MKKLVTSILIALSLFISCKNQNLVEYIEKGFAKPAVNDVRFSESSLGYGNKIYVPSGQEIEVEFTIKNKYEQEITGTLDISEDKKALFDTVPYIKSLTPTKMVIAFNFKTESEPSNQNSFLGASAPLDLKIYEKSTNRFLSRQNINANCNTPPLSINEIEYHQDRDEYTIKLPKIEGIHKDLKEVKLLLSSKNEAEGVKTTIIPINASTQDSLYTLTIKGNQDGQLANPAGDRLLKAIVYDKAGLNSNAEKTSGRHFTVLTLEPPNVDVDLDEVKNGVEPPKIKELVEYFQEEKYWKAAGYTVSYESTNFDYDSSKKKFMPKNPNDKGEYKVTVKLSFGSNHLTEDYKINVLGNDDAGIKTSTFAITDVTNYVTNYVHENYPKLTIPTPTFVNDGTIGKKCEVMIPYTGFVTKLRVHVDAVGSGKITETNSGTDEKNDFDVNLAAAYGSNETLTFYAHSSGGTSKQYRIEFIRKESVTVNVNVANELLQSDDCKVEMSWTYGKKEVSISKGQAGMSSDPFNVAKGAGVTFKIIAGNGDRIKECSSNEHSPITIDNPKTKSFELLASRNFILTVKFRAEASFKWVDIGKRESSEGYTKANVKYYLNDQEENYSHMIVTGTPSPIPEIAIQKDKPCVFWIEGLNPERHRILDWVVNTETLTTSKSDGSIILSDDKTSLTIKKPNGDYVVKVSTIPLYELEIQVCDSNGASITGHNYSFEVRKGTPTGGEIQKNPLGKYAGILSNIPVYITAQEGSNSEYEIDKWESKKTTDTTFAPLTGSSEIKNKRNLNITKDTIVRLTLKKKKFNINWSIEGSDQNISDPSKKTVVKVGGAPLASGTAKSVEIGNNIEFEITNLEEGRTIKGWEVNGNLKTTNETEITIENDKKKLTLTNIRQAHTVKLVLEPKKYIVTVYIHKPEATTHGYALKATKNGDGITGSMGAGTTNGDTKYTYSDVEHGSEMIFEATTQGSVYAIDKWEYMPRNVYNWQDITVPPVPSQYEGIDYPKKLKWTVDDTTILRVVLKKKTYKVSWSKLGGDATITAKSGNTSTPTNPVLSGNTEVTVDEKGSVELVASGLREGRQIKGWIINDTLYIADDASKGIKIENNKEKLTLSDIREIKNIVLLMEKKKYTLKVELEIPEGATVSHNYTIKATKSGQEITGEKENQARKTTYIYKDVEHEDVEGIWKFEAIPNNSSYFVTKWQYIDTDGISHDFDTSQYLNAEKTTVKWAPRKDVTLKPILALKPVKFSVVTNESSACNLIIKDKDDVELKQADIFDLPTSVDVDGNGKKLLKVGVSGYDSGYEVVLWKINGKVEKSFFDRKWKGDIKYEFKAGDEVEVTLEKIIRLGFFFGDGYFYNVNEQYKGKIKITITASEGQVFPNGDKGTVIDNGLILESDNAFFIEHVDEKVSFKVTRNAKINIFVEDLPSGKTVAWRYLDKTEGQHKAFPGDKPSEWGENPVKNWKIIEAYNNMLILMQIRTKS